MKLYRADRVRQPAHPLSVRLTEDEARSLLYDIGHALDYYTPGYPELEQLVSRLQTLCDNTDRKQA
jgi:hypothetical protein